MNPKNFFAELQRRNVYKVAVAYAVVAWLLIQIATQVFPFFDIPNWAVRFVIVSLLLGFPIAMILAWIFEWTPEGLKRTDEMPPSESVRRGAGRKLDFLLQEMNREVNTMGSKADGLRVSELIITAKAELEKMREQVQNVE